MWAHRARAGRKVGPLFKAVVRVRDGITSALCHPVVDTFDGSRLGPYLSKTIAVAAAIGCAELDFRGGTLPRVSVDGVPVAYDTSQTL